MCVLQISTMETTLSKYKDALKRAKERVLELQAEKVSRWVWLF